MHYINAKGVIFCFFNFILFSFYSFIYFIILFFVLDIDVQSDTSKCSCKGAVSLTADMAKEIL